MGLARGLNIGRNGDRKSRQFLFIEILCVSNKQGQYNTVVINWTSKGSSYGTLIVLIETFRYFAQSHHMNGGTLP